MVVALHTFPPLGRVSRIRNGTVCLSVVLEVADDDAEKPEEIYLWHTSGKKPWEETILSPASSTESPIFLQPGILGRKRFFYSATISMESTLHFTLKYRDGPTEPWIWARDKFGFDDGLVIPNADRQPLLTDDLSTIIRGLNSELKVKSVPSQTPRTRLWTIEVPASPAGDDHSVYADIELGTPWGGSKRYLALVRHSAAWLGPRHGRTTFSIDKDALLCSFLSHEGKHLVLLGLSNLNNVVTLLRSSDKGSVMIHLRNDGSVSSVGTLLAAVGDDCESAIAAAVYHARALMRFASSTPNVLSQDLSVNKNNDEIESEWISIDKEDAGIEPQWMQEWYDGLGYCTWNALGQRLTEEKLLNAVKSLRENNINISNLIIDDNWQDIDYYGPDSNTHGWRGFEAEPVAFPNGLKNTITRIRKELPSIEQVAVWHALLGYWGGISPRGSIAQRYRTTQVRREDAKADSTMTVISNEDVGSFYDDFYRFLVSCGIDGVKADVQFMVDTLTSAKHRRELTNSYLDAWTTSSLRHFGSKAISCMSQAPQILFRQQLPQNRPTITARNSDDYFPDVAESHPWHLWTNAHNALFTQHLNVLPDWDMFQSSHKNARYHAAARCVSGGPIYITDIPGQHDLDLINQMTGLTSRGKTVILRPSVVGKTIEAYTGYEEDLLLKIGSYHGRAATGTPILGVFNTRPHILSEIITLDSFLGITPSTKYIIRSHNNGHIISATDSKSRLTRIGITLDVGGCDVLTAYPVTQFDSETNGAIDISCLGLLGKMTGAAAIVANGFEFLPTGRVLSITRLKALGTLGLYISGLPDMSIEDDFMVTIQGSPIPPHTVTLDENDNHVLAVDVQTAWNEMGLSSGWSNEVEVKIYFDAEHC